MQNITLLRENAKDYLQEKKRERRE
jgi:hypothetical protein